LAFIVFADFAICLGVNQLKFDLVHRNLKHRHKAPESMKTIMFNKQDESDVRKQVRNLKAALSTNCLLSNSTVYLNNIPSSISGRGACARLRCYCGYISCAVDSMGWVSACEHMTGTLNIADTPMEKIWQSKEFYAQRHAVRTCCQKCWDSSHAEINIRLALQHWLHIAGQAKREAGYYLKKQGLRQ